MSIPQPQPSQYIKPTKNELLNSDLYFYRTSSFPKHPIQNPSLHSETSSLSTRIQELEMEIETINTQYNEMQSKLLKELEHETSLRKSAENECISKIQEYISKENATKQQYSNVNFSLCEKQSELRDIETKIAEMEDKIKTAKKNYEAQLLSMQSELNTKNELYSEELRRLKRENDALQSNTENELLLLKVESNKMIEQYDKVNKKLSGLKSKYVENNNQIKKNIDDLMNMKNNEQEEKKNELMNEFKQEENVVEMEYKRKLDDMEKEVSGYESNYKVGNKGFEIQYNELLYMKNELEKEMKNIKEENKILMEAYQTTSKDANKKKKEIETKDELIMKLTMQLNEFNTDVKKYYFATNMKVDEMASNFKEEKVKWEEERQKLYEEIDNLKIEEKNLKNENEQLKKYRESVKEDLKNFVKPIIEEKITNIK